MTELSGVLSQETGEIGISVVILVMYSLHSSVEAASRNEYLGCAAKGTGGDG